MRQIFRLWPLITFPALAHFSIQLPFPVILHYVTPSFLCLRKGEGHPQGGAAGLAQPHGMCLSHCHMGGEVAKRLGEPVVSKDSISLTFPIDSPAANQMCGKIISPEASLRYYTQDRHNYL